MLELGFYKFIAYTKMMTMMKVSVCVRFCFYNRNSCVGNIVVWLLVLTQLLGLQLRVIEIGAN